MEFIILGSLSFYIDFEKKKHGKYSNISREAAENLLKKYKHRAKCTDKRELLCEKIKN